MALGFSEGMIIGPALGADARRRGEPAKVFDWDKAARLLKESGAQTAEAGLKGDWDYTGGIIWENGKPASDHYTYLASNWATPQLIIDDGAPIDCWVAQPHEWDADTKWPESALAILRS
jgi:hypothetical protein